MDHFDFKGVQRTMLMPQWGRYLESRRENGLINDEMCIKAVEKAGFDFSEIETSQHPASRLAWAARAWNTDHELKKLTQRAEATVVCLGCGLETAYWRSGRSDINWYDIDLPEVIEARKHIIGESECTMISGSVLKEETYRHINLKGRLVVLALGLLCYFTPEQVGRVFENIARLSGSAYVVMDYFSEKGVKISNAVVLQNCAGAAMVWHADSPAGIEALCPGLNVIEYYPLFKKVMPLLGEAEAKLAAASDFVPVESMAVVEIR